MQPLSVSEMRESLRAKTLQSLDKLKKQPAPRVASMPCQRSTAPPRLKSAPCVAASTSDTIAELRRKLRDVEAERSEFFQEGVFDLVQFLCGSQENLGPNTSPWTLQVIEALGDFKVSKNAVEELREENKVLAHALCVVANACAMTPRSSESPVALAERLILKFS